MLRFWDHTKVLQRKPLLLEVPWVGDSIFWAECSMWGIVKIVLIVNTFSYMRIEGSTEGHTFFTLVPLQKAHICIFLTYFSLIINCDTKILALKCGAMMFLTKKKIYSFKIIYWGWFWHEQVCWVHSRCLDRVYSPSLSPMNNEYCLKEKNDLWELLESIVDIRYIFDAYVCTFRGVLRMMGLDHIFKPPNWRL